jgi:hypothetical protein
MVNSRDRKSFGRRMAENIPKVAQNSGKIEDFRQRSGTSGPF